MGDDARAVVVGQPGDHAQAQPNREILAGRRLQRAVPARGIDADRTHLDAVLACVAHDLRGRIEPHGLRVQQLKGVRRLGRQDAPDGSLVLFRDRAAAHASRS